MEEFKKDLTSLVELSNQELAKNPPPLPAIEHLQPVSDILETTLPTDHAHEIEFQSLEELSKNQLAVPEDLQPEHAQPESLIEPSTDLVQNFVSSETQSTKSYNLSEIQKLGEKITIGEPILEARPPFSLLAFGNFNEKTIQAIEAVFSSENYGVRPEDIQVQLSSGKLFVPNISEFAAVSLAQKLHDLVENIEIDLAGEIYQSSATNEEGLIDANRYRQKKQEVLDLENLPVSEKEVFASNLTELQDYYVTRVLSVITSSEVITEEVAHNPQGNAFEKVTEKLTADLIRHAFQLKANGVLGVHFSMHPISMYPIDKISFRVFAVGTAVRAKSIRP